jgi:hypothetical protein
METDYLVKPTAFYSNEREKTKLNWFCYELAHGLEIDLNKKTGERLRKHRVFEKDIAKFSIYISKKMKGIIPEKLSGKIDKTYFSYEWIEAYFPKLRDDKLVDDMLMVIAKTWDEQLSIFETYPNRCISEKDNYCTIFDDKNILI